jgi:hypothetical protein
MQPAVNLNTARLLLKIAFGWDYSGRELPSTNRPVQNTISKLLKNFVIKAFFSRAPALGKTF